MDSNLKESSVSGVVTRIVSEGPLGGAIFKVREMPGAKTTRINAPYNILRDGPWPGELVDIKGTYEEDRYDFQMIASSVQRRLPQSAEIISLVEHHPFFIGIGRSSAMSLWRRTGTTLYSMLESYDFDALNTHGLTRRQAVVFVRAWAQYRFDITVESLAQRLKLSLKVARAAYRMWGADAEDKIKHDPYCLLWFDTWPQVDKRARDVLGLEDTSMRRRAAACVKVLDDAASKGILKSDKSEVLKHAGRLLGNDAVGASVLRDCIKKVKLLSGKTGKEVWVQSHGAYVLETSFCEFLRLRRPTRRLSDAGILDDGYQTPEMEVIVNHMPMDLGPILVHCEKHSTIHLFSSFSVSSRLGRLGLTPVCVQDVLASGVEGFGHVQTAVLHDASNLSFFVLHGILRRLVSVTKIILVLNRPFVAQPHFEQLLGTESPAVHVGQTTEKVAPTMTAWIEPSRSFFVPENLLQLVEKSISPGRFLSLAMLSRDSRDLASSRYRMCVAVGSSIVVTLTKHDANILNRQFHEENIDARRYQGLPIPLVALSHRQFATTGDSVIFDGSSFTRRLLNGSRGQIVEVYPRGRIEEDDEGGIYEVAIRAQFDGVGDVNIRRSELELLRLGYATSYHESLQPRVEFAIFLVTRSRFSAADGLLRAESHAATATIIVSSTEDWKKLDFAMSSRIRMEVE